MKQPTRLQQYQAAYRAKLRRESVRAAFLQAKQRAITERLEAVALERAKRGAA